ncbi:MAG: outer membrane lipoprotein carrier protein LolA [Bryobacteraceae bacterium]
MFGADPNLPRILKGVEERYNRAKTLQVVFEETYTVNGRARKAESGDLFLRKPGRMRWDYKAPAGKLFLSDGKDVFLYTPSDNSAEKMKLKESDDMRAPLAFLLGKLEFEKEFQNFQTAPAGDGSLKITAIPKSDRLPYREVDFFVTPDYKIHKLNITGQDSSVLTFVLRNEQVNPALDDKLFRFNLPAGATLKDASK